MLLKLWLLLIKILAIYNSKQEFKKMIKFLMIFLEARFYRARKLLPRRLRVEVFKISMIKNTRTNLRVKRNNLSKVSKKWTKLKNMQREISSKTLRNLTLLFSNGTTSGLI